MSLEHYRENGFQDPVLNLELSLIVSYCEDQSFLMFAHHELFSNVRFLFEDVFFFQGFWGHNDLGKTQMLSLLCSRVRMILKMVANTICN